MPAVRPRPLPWPQRARVLRPSLWLALTLALAILTPLRPVPATAQTLDEILANHYKARGGMDKLKAVKTARMTGRMAMGMGIETPVTLEMMRPMMMRMDASFQGMNIVQAYDGTNGWQVMPFGGDKDPQPMSAEDQKEVEGRADIDGVLVDWKAKGHNVELMGKESVDGTDAYKLKVTLKNGDVQYSYIDAEYWLEIKTESKTKRMGGEVEVEVVYGDFKPVDGIVFPYSLEMGAKGSDQKQKLTIEKIELNPPVDAARFKMPAVAPAAAGEKKDEAKPDAKKGAPPDPKAAPKPDPKAEKKG